MTGIGDGLKKRFSGFFCAIHCEIIPPRDSRYPIGVKKAVTGSMLHDPIIRAAGYRVCMFFVGATMAALMLAAPVQAGARDRNSVDYLENDAWPDAYVANDVDLILVDSSPIIGDFSVDVQLAQAEDDANDPLEPLNRAIFAFNDVVYDALLGPLADAYNLLPVEIRTIIGSILSNLRAPIVLMNDILQGEAERAVDTFARFAINSTFGFAGMADVAASAGFESHGEDFGQTMAVWGVGEGFYLVLPLLGPSNPRDAIGKFGVDRYVDPFSNYLDNTGRDEWEYARTGTSAIDEFSQVRSELDNIKRTSIDYYAAVRSLYRQRRAAEISNGDDLALPPIPDFDMGEEDLFQDGTEPATLELADGTVIPANAFTARESASPPLETASGSAAGGGEVFGLVRVVWWLLVLAWRHGGHGQISRPAAFILFAGYLGYQTLVIWEAILAR